MRNQSRIEKFIEDNKEMAYKMLKELCLIPSPSFNEEKRAQYCVEKLNSMGMDAYIDSALNVVCPINCDNSNKIAVLCGHTDTVFPEKTPLLYEEKEGKIFCPSVGDDTAAVVALILIVKYIKENNLTPRNGLLIVCNSGEESVGDLKGTKQIFKDFSGRIEKFVSLDGDTDEIYSDSVGGYKFEITAKVQGGHALSNFGRKNAIEILAKIITQIYQISLPEKEGYVYSYNVGVIEGGTSVNAIAQEAKMQCEYRSNKLEYRAILKEKFDAIIDSVKADDVEISIKTLSDRPCANGVDMQAQEKLIAECSDIIEEVNGKAPKQISGSTDCNIPLSMGIPAVAIGVIDGGGAHTKEEWIYKESVLKGLKIALATAEKIGDM